MNLFADHGPEHENPVSVQGGRLSVSPSIIVDGGVVRYNYTPSSNFPNSYPSWDRLTYKSGTLYYTQGYRQGDPFFYFFRPVRWGTFSFSPNTDRCPRAPEGASTEVILELARQCDALIGCKSGDTFCELKVRANRRQGEDWRGHFWPNCRAQYYLGPFPDTSGGGSQATSKINLFLRDAFDSFDPQVINPLTLASSGPIPDCPDPDPIEPLEPALEFSCDDANGDQASVNIELNSDETDRVDFEADIYNVCEFYGEEFDFGDGGGDPDCDPEFESCDDLIDACVEQSTINWSFGDGNSENSTSAYDTVFHNYEEAGDYTVTATVQPFDVSTQCELKLEPPGVRVDVQPIGTKLATMPDGSIKRRATLGSAFAMNVVVRTTEGFGKVKDLNFVNDDLLGLGGDLFTLLEKPEFPDLPAEVSPKTEFFSGKFILEATAEGEAIIDAPVTYSTLNTEKTSNDQEIVSVGKGLKVDVFGSKTVELSDTNFDSNVFHVEVHIENNGNVDFVDLKLDPNTLFAGPVPNSPLPLGSVTLIKDLAPPVPTSLAAGEKHITSATLRALEVGDVRVGTVVKAEDEDGNYFEIGKGTDIRIVEEGFLDEKMFWRTMNDLVREQIEQLYLESQELEGRAAAMITHMIEAAASGGDLAAASQAVKDACEVPGTLFSGSLTAESVASNESEFGKRLKEKSYLPDFVKTTFSDEAREANPALEFLSVPVSHLMSSEEAITETIDETVDNLGAIGTVAGFLSVEHNRDQLASSITGSLKEFGQGNIDFWDSIYEGYVNGDAEAANLIESTFISFADDRDEVIAGECRKMANNLDENMMLLAEGEYAEFHFKTTKASKKTSLTLLVEAMGGFGSKKLMTEGAERFSKTVIGKNTLEVMDASKTKVRESTRNARDQFNTYRGKFKDKITNKVHSGPLGKLKNKATRGDRSAPSPATSITPGVVSSIPDFDDYVGGLSPLEQNAMKEVAGRLEQAKVDYANTLPGPARDRILNEQIEVQLTPTNPFSSPEWRRKNGLPLVSPKEEIMKAKSLNEVDVLLGAPRKYLGSVGIFDPTTGYNKLPPALQEKYRGRYLSQLETWDKYKNKPNSELNKNIARATQPGGDVFLKSAPTAKSKRYKYNDKGEKVEIEGPVVREIPQHWEVVTEQIDSAGGEFVTFKDLRAPGDLLIGGDMDGQFIGFLSGENVPAGLKARLRGEYRQAVRDKSQNAASIDGPLFSGDLRFADHGATKLGADWEAAFDHKRIDYLIERVPAQRGRELAREWVNIQNEITRKKFAHLPEDELQKKLIDYDDYVETLEFGTKLTSITANNVRVVDGESLSVKRVIDLNRKRLLAEPEGS